MDIEAPREKPPEITAEFLRQGAYHVATQFGTGVPYYKDLIAAADALEKGDREKAERILGVKLPPTNTP